MQNLVKKYRNKDIIDGISFLTKYLKMKKK